MSAFKDLAGKKFNRLTAETPIRKNGKVYWICRCECGNTKEVSSGNLVTGAVMSCGCLQRERSAEHCRSMATHKMFGTRLYRIWTCMNDRCYNPHHPHYGRYGGRGIKVCDEWKSDKSRFFDWAKNNGYSDSLSIDRINNDGNYEPSNCRWATMREQQLNRSSNHIVTVDGVSLPITEMCERLSIKYETYSARRRYGWSEYDALTKPVAHKKGKVVET